MDSIHLDQSALKAVDDYWEYRRIVGDDDGGKLFTPEQYDEYKRKVLPQRIKNRLYVSFGVPGGIDCKLIGPETQCFCAHRYKEHKTEWEVVPFERPLVLPCKVRGCHCSAFHYVPRLGPNPVRCRCKHLPQDHSEVMGHFCKMCTSCSGFRSPYTCGCGQPCSAHQTLVETKLEREARGQPVGKDVPYAAMGGLTGFSSLLDGYIALEASCSDQDSDYGCLQSCSASRTSHTSKTSSSVPYHPRRRRSFFWRGMRV
ncbi:protein FAM221A [Odontesthes bonariensis]|uniref:protein FAM221A n=1 Tax=Odontesthes bonariensis TaxID=219752 RepID=UPI003F584A72